MTEGGNPDKDSILIQDVLSSDESCDEKIYLDFNFHDNPQVEALAIKSFGVELNNHVVQSRKGNFKQKVLPQSLQNNAYIHEINVKNLWSQTVQKKAKGVRSGQSLQKQWNKEINRACQSIKDYVPSQAMQVAAALTEMDYFDF